MKHQELSSRLVSLCFILWGILFTSVYADANTLPRHMVNVTAEGAACRLSTDGNDQINDIINYLKSYLTDQENYPTKNVDINHTPLPELQYTNPRIPLADISVYFKPLDNLCEKISALCQRERDDEPYYYHPDHLGGAAWITDNSGTPVQYLHYAPYGELVANQIPYGYDERFKFTGKERDAETGYDYFGARYYWSRYSIFESVDPLVDKFIDKTPYLYCDGNPIRNIDPIGMDIYRYDEGTGDFKLYQKTDDNFDQIGKFKYDRKTKEYKPRLNKDGSIKTYSDHLGNNDKIAKGILQDGLNIKQNGARFISDNTKGPSLSDFHNFALILDEVAGVEISGYVLEAPGEKNRKIVQIEPYKNNKIDRSSNRLMNFAPFNVFQHFHTHGHAGYNEAITPSERYDIPFKDDVTTRYPGIQLLILHNYGAPIKY